MAQENSAHGAPRGGFAQAPTGFRRLTPGLLRADQTAQGFAGMPEGVTSPGLLLAALKAAAPRLGISPRLVHAVDWLFRFTQPQDWEREARPIVWPSARMQQEELSLSETQVKRVNRTLSELGLLTMRDSPNGKRYGKRDPKGGIVEAYGFDLSPIAARHAEFVRVAEEARAERAAMGRLRRRATIARKAIAQILETAREYAFTGEEWQTLATETLALTRALRVVERPDEMETGVKSLERRQIAARERIEVLLQDVKMDGSQAKNGPHQYNYNPTLNPEQDTVIAAKRRSEAGEEPVLYDHASLASAGAGLPPKRSEKGMVEGIRPDELVRLTPRLKLYLPRSNPSWPDIIDAADWLRHDLGVSKSLWGDACVAMGRELAAVAMAIVSAKDPEHFQTTPGGYFHGMVAKARAGELHLDRTVWALRRALAPQRREQGRGESRSPRDSHRAW
jgi:replication initiation protein RepC